MTGTGMLLTLRVTEGQRGASIVWVSLFVKTTWAWRGRRLMRACVSSERGLNRLIVNQRTQRRTDTATHLLRRSRVFWSI